MMGDHKHLLKPSYLSGEPAGPWSKVPKEFKEITHRKALFPPSRLNVSKEQFVPSDFSIYPLTHWLHHIYRPCWASPHQLEAPYPTLRLFWLLRHYCSHPGPWPSAGDFGPASGPGLFSCPQCVFPPELQFLAIQGVLFTALGPHSWARSRISGISPE